MLFYAGFCFMPVVMPHVVCFAGSCLMPHLMIVVVVEPQHMFVLLDLPMMLFVPLVAWHDVSSYRAGEETLGFGQENS